MNEIENRYFQEISLGQIEDVRFMNRIDRKYCMVGIGFLNFWGG